MRASIKKKKKSRATTRGGQRTPARAKASKHRKKVSSSKPSPDGDAARIIAAVKKIPRGKVCTYGNVADAAGLPRRARLVGTVLRQTSVKLPWFRVINASGRISFPQGSDSYARQRKLLEDEGVDFVGGRVDLRRYGWPSREKLLDELLWAPPQ